MNLQTIEFHHIDVSNVELLFRPYEEHYRSTTGISSLRKGLTELADYMKGKAERVYYAKINKGTTKFEENFSLCVNHCVRMSVKSESTKVGAVQSNGIKPFGTFEAFNAFALSLERHADTEQSEKIVHFFRGLFKALESGYVMEIHYCDGEFDFIAQNNTIGHTIEIYLEILN